MSEADQTVVLNQVFAILRERAAKLRASGDFYEGSYIAGELDNLPGYIVPRMQGPEAYAAHVKGLRDRLAALRARDRDIDLESQLWDEESERPEPDRRKAADEALYRLLDESSKNEDEIDSVEEELRLLGEKVRA